MELYVWWNVETLALYSSGTAFAMANSIEEAIYLIAKNGKTNLKVELESKEPTVYNHACGFSMMGSD